MAAAHGRNYTPPSALTLLVLRFCCLLAASLLLLLLLPMPTTSEAYSTPSTIAAFDWDLNEMPPEAQPVDIGSQTAAGARASGGGGGGPNLFDRMKARASSAVAIVKGKLPEYFNFDKFKSSLKRSYKQAELVYRKSRFLESCMRVFKARVDFRLGRIGHLEKVNGFSDRSPNELKRMFMSGPPLELRPKGQSVEEYLEQMRRERARREQFDAELNSQCAAISARGRPASADEVTIISESQVERQLNQMLAGVTLDPAARAAMREEIFGAPVEMSSQASALDLQEDLPWPGQASSASFVSSVADVADRLAYKPPQASATNEATIDWSRHPCFHKIYNQGDACGMCYVMASTTAAEFYKCSEQKDVAYPRQFSKEFVLDCSQKYSPSILGCSGGSIMDTVRFISQAGTHSIKGWKQKRLDELRRLKGEGITLNNGEDKCPYNQYELPFEKWGEVRVELNPKLVHPNDWLAALKDGPLVVTVRMPTEGVVSYAAGTHSGAGCETSDYWHSMVLVGYGIDERNTPYWRFRNSYGPEWGDKGHFNLAAGVSGECLVGGVRIFREPLADPQR